MAASILQETFAENTAGATTLSKAFGSNVTAASSIHAVGVAYATPRTLTFSDGINTYTSNLDNSNDGFNVMAQGYALNAAAGATTVTLTLNSSTGLGLLIREVGGCSTSAIDNHTGTFVATGDPSVSLTLNAAGALISAVAADLANGTSMVAGSGYTSGQSNVWLDNNGTKSGTSESQHFSTSGSKSVTFTDGTVGGLLAAMSFADGGGAIAAQPYAEDDRNEDEVSDEPLYAAYDSAPVGPAQPARPVEDIQGGDELDHIEDEAAVLDAGASAPVGPAQPPLPVEDIYGEPDDLWDDSELWGADSAPVGPNQPAPPVEDPAPDFEDVWDDIEIWLADSAPVGPNVIVVSQALPEDPWNWEEIDDELEIIASADSSPVGPNQPSPPTEDIQGEPDDVWDDMELLAAVDSAPVGPNAIIVLRQPAEDPWDWQDDADDELDLLAASDSGPVGPDAPIVIPPGFFPAPNLVGLHWYIASKNLMLANLNQTKAPVKTASRQAPPGYVLYQDPPAGTFIATGTNFQLTVVTEYLDGATIGIYPWFDPTRLT